MSLNFGTFERPVTRAEFLEVAGAGHGVHDDRPGWLVQTILDWLQRAAP